jgi:ligand-binding sensor domain-containing protein
MKKFTYIILSIVALTIAARGNDMSGWTTVTSAREVRHLDYFNDTIQVVSSGGWLKIDPVTTGVAKVTNTDGLGTNDLHYVLRDTEGTVWLAGYGRLVRYRNGVYTPFLFYDRDGNLLTLYCLADDGDYLWAGTSIGLALFSKVTYGGQIEDFYYRFGGIDPESEVYDIELSGDSIWLATSGGLATADRSDPRLLKSFASWHSFKRDKYFELSVDQTTAVHVFRDTIFIGNSRNAFKLRIDGGDTSFIEIPTREPSEIRRFNTCGDSLYIYANDGFYIYSSSGIVWNNTPSIPTNNFTAGLVIDGVHWAGTAGEGVYFGGAAGYENIDDGGLPGNYVSALAASGGVDVAGGFYYNGSGWYEGDKWNDIDMLSNHWVTSAIYDNQGRLWLGQWGGGLNLVTSSGLVNFDENNSSLRGVSEGPFYVVVYDMAIDGNYMFMTNYRALDGNPVSAVDLSDPFDANRWISFGAADGIMTDRVLNIDARDGVFVIGTENSGVYYYYYGSNPFNKTDDSVVNMREDNRWLGANTVLDVNLDHNGTLRVGTTAGMSYYDSGIDRFRTVSLPLGFGPAVYEIAVDSRNFVWMGALNGLGRQNPISGEVDVFTTLNSGLTSDRVTALIINGHTGDAWIGTSAGLSIKKSEFGPVTSDVDDVIAFPNPFVIDGASDNLKFNFEGKATVHIYTVNGDLVRVMDINENWNGKNQQGRDVTAGVYLFLMTAEDGSVGRGKILLIRR